MDLLSKLEVFKLNFCFVIHKKNLNIQRTKRHELVHKRKPFGFAPLSPYCIFYSACNFFFATCINSKNTYFINIIEILYTCLLLIYKNTFKVILRYLSDCENCNAIISALISRQTLSEIILNLTV